MGSPVVFFIEYSENLCLLYFELKFKFKTLSFAKNNFQQKKSNLTDNDISFWQKQMKLT